MRQIYSFIFIVGIAVMTEAGNLPIIPSPQKVDFKDTAFELTDDLVIVIEDGVSAENDRGLEMLQSTLIEVWNIEPEISSGDQNYKKTIRLSHLSEGSLEDDFSSDMAEECYVLDIDSNYINVAAKTDIGRFHGLMSLVQLVKGYSTYRTLPGLVIEDYPAMKWRGVSDDISRGQVSTLENFEEIIRFLAEYKMNIYMPYLEDMVELDRYPDIGVGRGALSKSELKHLQDYARGYYIDIIPVFQTLGHFENILQLEDYIKYAEFPGAASLNVSSGAAMRFLNNMLDEVVPLFDSRYFHMGADESWDVGRGASADDVEKRGIAAVHADHYRKVYDRLKRDGKEVLMYGDIVLRNPEILDLIPKDIIIVDWHYWPNDIYPSVKIFKDSGFQVLVSPGIHNWNNPFPNFRSAWTNISNINMIGYRQNVLGSVISNWGDYGGPNFRELNYLGYAYGAETSWNPEGMDYCTIDKRFFLQFFGTDDIGMRSLLLHLNEIPDNSSYKELWRQPFYGSDKNSSKLILRSQKIKNSSITALKIVENMRNEVSRNKDHLDYYKFAADVGSFIGEKLALARKVELFTVDESLYPSSEYDLDQMKLLCSDLIQKITVLEKDYKKLWLRTNRPENMGRILNLFRHQRAYFEEMQQELDGDDPEIISEIPSGWITADIKEEFSRPEPSYLRKKFNISVSKGIKGAKLQLIADSEANIYLNGDRAGKVIATKSLSLLVENQRVGSWDVKDKIVDGDNYLAVEVQGYNRKRPSSANVYLEIEWTDGSTVRVLSDTTWEASINKSFGWKTGKGGKWMNAKRYNNYPWRISAPLFNRGYSSRIEF